MESAAARASGRPATGASASDNEHGNGGGGNRTRVPKHFKNGLYVRSRSFDLDSRDADRQAARPSSSTVFSSDRGRAARSDQPANHRLPA